MTRKDYQLIAKAIAESERITWDEDEDGNLVDMIHVEDLIDRLCWALYRDNPAFSSSKFRAACRGV